MDIVSILGLGAIGLGFLLAFLTYRLLSNERTDNTPIYVFQFFCFALVLIGAWLQYASTSGSKSIVALQAKVVTLENEFTANESKVDELQEELATTKNERNTAQQKAKQATEKLASSIKVMKTIASMVPKSIKDLESVNAVLTGLSCSGGSHGKPLWEGLGTKTAKLSTSVIKNLTAAKSSIDALIPKE